VCSKEVSTSEEKIEIFGNSEVCSICLDDFLGTG
jgi:hypothetical protein